MKRFEPGTKIVDRFDVSAGDRDVVVERWENEEDAMGPPPGVSDVAWRTIYSPLVMVVRVNSVTGYVAEDGMWIESQVTGTITQLLKNATTAELGPNSPVAFFISGGTITIGAGVLEAITRTRAHRTAQFRPNRDYLVFVVKIDGGRLRAHPDASYEIVGHQLRPLRVSEGGIHKRIADAGTNAVIAEVVASRGLQATPRKRGGVK